MGSELVAHEVEGRMGYWLRGHEGERGIIVLVKSACLLSSGGSKKRVPAPFLRLSQIKCRRPKQKVGGPLTYLKA